MPPANDALPATGPRGPGESGESLALEREAIAAAAVRIAPYIRRTPCLTLASHDLGLEPGYEVVLKLELLQHTGSFKPRGAYNRVLSADVPAAGLIAASGGNHGLAVAHAARALGYPAEIFVPESAPQIKVERLRRLGARTHQVGQVYDEAREACELRARETGAVMVHAYDQPEVVAGAGTVCRELLEQAGTLDAILVAVGGGGLIGGTSAWARGDIQVIAVEPERCAAMHTALTCGAPTAVEVGGVAVDSLAARQVGAIPFACARRWVSDAILVPDAAIVDAQRQLWDRVRLIAEPGGATALSALLAGAYRPAPGSRIAVLVCGANAAPGAIGG